MGAVIKRMHTPTPPPNVGTIYRTDIGQPGKAIPDVLTAFYDSRRAGIGGAKRLCRETTIRAYSVDLARFRDHLKAQKIDYWNQLGAPTLQNYFQQIRESKWAETTKYHHYRSLKALLRWIARDGECQRLGMKPFLDLIPVIPANPPKVWVPTPEQVEQFIAIFDRRLVWDLRDFVICRLLQDNGMRIGEICNLLPEHLKLDAHIILVPVEGKTGSRPVPISPQTVPHLKEWLTTREKIAKSRYLFVSKFGGKCAPNTVEQAFARARARSGVEEITPHSLRHYFATYYLVRGGPIQNLKQILGHTSFNTLQIYINLAAQLTKVVSDHAQYSPANMIVGKTRKRNLRTE